MKIYPDAFSTKEDALASIAAIGWHPLVREVKPERNEPHVHPFDSVIYVIDGSMDFFDVDAGEFRRCGPGTRVEDFGANLHREDHNGYTAVVGFAQDPVELFGDLLSAPPQEQAGPA